MRHQPRRVLTSSERGFIKREIRELETQLGTPEMVGLGVWAPNPMVPQQHRDKTARRLAELKRHLEQGSVQEMSRSAKQKRDRRIKELEERVRKRLIPSKFFHAKREDSKDYHKAVDHEVALAKDPQHQQEVSELKNLLRERAQEGARFNGSQEDPNAGNIEHLRK